MGLRAGRFQEEQRWRLQNSESELGEWNCPQPAESENNSTKLHQRP